MCHQLLNPLAATTKGHKPYSACLATRATTAKRNHTAAAAPAGCNKRKPMYGNEDPEQPIDKQETKYIFLKKEWSFFSKNKKQRISQKDLETNGCHTKLYWRNNRDAVD